MHKSGSFWFHSEALLGCEVLCVHVWFYTVVVVDGASVRCRKELISSFWSMTHHNFASETQIGPREIFS